MGHDLLPKGRGGAGDEGARSHVAGDGQEITWFQAAGILGMSDRHLWRYREQYERAGVDGVLDRRRCWPSEKRVPLATVERVLATI